MAQPHVKASVVKAIIGNALVALAKAVAWLISGSGAMLAETVHSVVDTLNQCLLLVGTSRASGTATPRHPYGFGLETNFWSLLAAIGILIFGSGVTLEHGIERLAHPKMPEQVIWIFVVLAAGIIIEGFVLWSVLARVAETRRDTGWWTHLRRQSAGTLTVIYEDSAAVLGCGIAAVAVALCVVTSDAIYDALAQVVIGAMLGLVGLSLVWRNWAFLIGRALPPEEVQRLRIFLEDRYGVERVTDIKTRMLTASTFKLKAEVVFSGGQLAGRIIPDFATRLQSASRERDVNEILGRYADRVIAELAQQIDQIEQEIREAFPGAVHIDLEPHLRDL